MLLAIDAGNTQTHIGVFSGPDLIADWRTSTEPQRTSDELALYLQQLLAFRNLSFSGVDKVAIASVVPSLTISLKEMVARYLHQEALVVGPGIKTGMPILTENPKEVGADRIVNSLAAFDLVGGPLVVVDFGTATTFDAISAAGEYLGGAICPGIQVSAGALWNSAAQLTRVELAAPRSVIGRTTPESIRSGIVLGAAAMVDGMVQQMQKELGGEARVIGTGGLAALILPHCDVVVRHEPFLTLNGLRILHERNLQT